MHWYILDTRTPMRTQTHMFTLHLASSNCMWLYERTLFSNLISGRIVIIQTVDAYFLLISQVTARALWWIGHDWTLFMVRCKHVQTKSPNPWWVCLQQHLFSGLSSSISQKHSSTSSSHPGIPSKRTSPSTAIETFQGQAHTAARSFPSSQHHLVNLDKFSIA